MDLKVLMDGSDGRWTEERHSRFLNWLEADFVRRELAVRLDGGDGPLPCRCMEIDGDLRLDRYIPVSATESTEDSRRCSTLEAEALIDSESRCSTNTRKRPLALRDACRDQVVPESESSEEEEVTSGSVKTKHRRG